MKVAVSSKGETLDSDVSDIFGRCPYFIIAEINENNIIKFEAIENSSASQNQGAGTSAAQLVAEKDVGALITGNVGPRALDVLKQFNIEIYNGSGTVNESLQKFICGELEKS